MKCIEINNNNNNNDMKKNGKEMYNFVKIFK